MIGKETKSDEQQIITQSESELHVDSVLDTEHVMQAASEQVDIAMESAAVINNCKSERLLSDETSAVVDAVDPVPMATASLAPVEITATATSNASEVIVVSVRDATGHIMRFSVKPHFRLSKLFRSYATKSGANLSQLRFTWRSERLSADMTVQGAELKTADIVDVRLQK